MTWVLSFSLSWAWDAVKPGSLHRAALVYSDRARASYAETLEAHSALSSLTRLSATLFE